jgi:hypothetical protein
MVALGVGKNMVRAIRFWAQVTGIIEPCKDGGYQPTRFGSSLLGPAGLDPYLEDIRTLWLLHWQISTNVEEPLFAWDYMLNRWQHPEVNRREAVQSFKREAERLERQLSPVTLEQHFDTFLHTYVPTRGSKREILEDSLDSPFVELELILRVGERRVDKSGKHETIYAFRREPKPEISAELFLYCVEDFWLKRHSTEQTLSFRELAVGHGGPGQIFKLPERDLRDRLESIEIDSQGHLEYRESAALQQLVRVREGKMGGLKSIYAVEGQYV